MAKHNRNKNGNISNNNNQFKNKNRNLGNQSAGGSTGTGSNYSASGSEEGVFGKVKDKLSDATPSFNTMKSGVSDSLPSILQWGAVALGVVGVYALYRNRAVISQFIEDKDISLPSFMKGSDDMATIGAGSTSKARGKLGSVSNTH